MKPHRRNFLLPLSFLLLASAIASTGCSGNEEGSDEDDSELRADQVNAQAYALDRIMFWEHAGEETERQLGIESWDVFAGRDPRSGFEGTVFYASDESRDVRYAFIASAATREVTFLALTKEGAPDKEAKVDAAAYGLLLQDVARLKATLEDRMRGGGVTCALGFAYMALSVVAAAGSIAVTTGVGLGIVASGGLLGVPAGVALGAAVGASSLVKFAGVTVVLDLTEKTREGLSRCATKL